MPANDPFAYNIPGDSTSGLKRNRLEDEVAAAFSPDTGFRNALDVVAQSRGEGAPTQDIPLHASNFRNLARIAEPVLGPVTGPALEGAGLVNEGIDAVRGFFSNKPQAGFDQSDLVANKIGIDKGIAESQARRQAAQDRLKEIIAGAFQ